MTKLLIITSEFPPQPGGIGAHAHHVASSLSEYSYTVTVLADQRSSSGLEEVAFDAKQNYSIVRIKRKQILLSTYLKRIIKAYSMSKTQDAVMVSGKFSLWIGGILSLLSSVRIIAVLHGSEVAIPPSFKKNITKWCVRRFSKVIAVSGYTKSLVSDWGIASIVVIPNGFYIEASISESKTKTKVIQLITVGNVTQRKGQYNVVRALPEILKRFPNSRYDIVGIPTEKIKVQQYATKLGVEDRIIFHGKVSEEKKIALLKQAKVFIMLSQATSEGDVEGFGIAILEANALGLPAIGATNCGIEDAISQNNSGKLVAYEDTTAIVEALSDILQDYEGYSQRASTWSEQFVWDSIIKKYIEVLRS